MWIPKKTCVPVIVCLLLSLCLTGTVLASSTSEDTNDLLEHWESIINSPDFIEDKSYQTDDKLVVSPSEAIYIAVETIKELEKIGADALVDYTPSLTIRYVIPPHFPHLRSGYWGVKLTNPEGKSLNSYFVDISVSDPSSIKYNVLSPDGEVTKVLYKDLDGRFFVPTEVPGHDESAVWPGD